MKGRQIYSVISLFLVGEVLFAGGMDHGSERQLSKTSSKGQSARETDRTTLTGKVMVGYQGWFNCEGDGAELGWTHWARNRRRILAPGNVTVDLWPDMSELQADERFATGFTHADGSAAEVFSSGNRKTVERHFRWMRDYGIDGAFLQRFAHGLRSRTGQQHKDNVLSHVRDGAEEAGRSYAVMYDLSGLPKGGTEIVRKDWANLHQAMRITEDRAYQHHRGKPVVAVWGIGFSDRTKPREYTLDECRRLVKFLKASGCAVMLGVPTGWRSLDRDSIADPELHRVLRMADVVSPWTVGRYRDSKGVQRHAKQAWTPDVQWCKTSGIDYMPVVFPGFSWHNLKGDRLDAIPRMKGEFLWSQITAAHRSGCEMLYVAMFDEVDEGTAIFKCSNDPPTGAGVSFLTYEGLPSDHYLRLTGRAGMLLRGELENEQQ
ncbi:MAG: glycoside hydrolase family 71/99-like protein [Planctomycetota bacterium]